MRVLMTGGVSGGHINPALSIARIIKEREPDSEIAFVGTPRGMENELVSREGYKMYHIVIRGVRRGKILDNVKTLRYMASSLRDAKRIIKDFKPDVCIGTGGFVSWPLIRAAQSMGVPTALHESNALAGMAVKALSRRLDVLFTNFDCIKDQVKCKNVIKSGNPMRNGFSGTTEDEAKTALGLDKYEFSVLSCGGSLGAEMITEEVIKTMEHFSSKHGNVHHLHQSGSRRFEKAQSDFKAAGLDKYENLELKDYIYDMPTRLLAADLIIARAGAMTISELAYLKKPAVLIPSPNVVDNHQYKNAKALADKGAAVMIEESELDGTRLEKAVSELLSDAGKREALSKNIGAFTVENTDEIIFDGIKAIIKK